MCNTWEGVSRVNNFSSQYIYVSFFIPHILIGSFTSFNIMTCRTSFQPKILFQSCFNYPTYVNDNSMASLSLYVSIFRNVFTQRLPASSFIKTLIITKRKYKLFNFYFVTSRVCPPLPEFRRIITPRQVELRLQDI